MTGLNSALSPRVRHLLINAVKTTAKRMGLIDLPESHQSSAYWVLSRYISIEDKHVLEIGGVQSGEAAKPFLDNGAAGVVISGLDHVTEETVTGDRLRIIRANALSLSQVFESESFDVVFGLSIVEHIPSPKIFLEELYNILRPGGIAYLQGAPMWSSAKGHHLWVASWEGSYQDKTTANYLFNPQPGKVSTNPLPDWSHLLMSQNVMADYLKKKTLPDVDIECILDWVYNSDQVNRLDTTEIAAAYSTSKLILLEANTKRHNVPPEIGLALHKKYGEGLDYGTSGISYVLLKR